MKTKKGFIFRVVTAELEPEQFLKLLDDARKVFNTDICECVDYQVVDPEELTKQIEDEWEFEEGVRNSI